MSVQTIAITGVSGFIGTELAEYLATLNFKVIGIDGRQSNERLKSIGSNYQHYVADLYFKESIDLLFEKIAHPNLIVHLAGVTRVKDAKNDPISSIKANILGTANLYVAYQEHCTKKLKKGSFLFASSSELENISHLYSPTSIYSTTKQCAEELIKSLNNPEIINTSILRLCTVYGGEMELKDKLPRIFIEKAIMGKQIIINPDSKINPSFIFIRDLMKIISELSLDLMNSSNNSSVKTLTIDGEEASLGEIIRHIENISGMDIDYVYGDNNLDASDINRKNIAYEYKKIKPKSAVGLSEGLKATWNISKKQINS